MRAFTVVSVTAGLLLSQAPEAQAQIPQQLLQGLMGQSGGQAQNPNQEQVIREAYERGYRQGRQDQEQSDQGRAGRSQNGGNQQQYPNQTNQRNTYGR